MSASRQKKLRKEQQAAAAPETKRRVTEEEKAAKRLKIWSAVFYIVIAAMVLGLLAAAVWNSGLLQRMFTAVTVGEHKISAAQMNYFCADTINSDQFLPYFADTTKTLGQQQYDEENTFADHYYAQAIERAKAVYAAYDQAVANGFTLSEESKTGIETMVSNLDGYAAMSGYSNGNALLRAQYGKGCNTDNYKEYLTVVQLASEYLTEYQGSLTATEQEILDEVTANAVDYTSYSYRYQTFGTNDYYEGEKDAEGNYTEEQTAAAFEAAKADAQTVLEEVNGNADAFAEKEKSTMTEDGPSGRIPAALKEWLTAGERTEGEATLIEMDNQGGCYVVMFLGTNDNTTVFPVNVRHILIQTDEEKTGTDASGNAVYSAEQMAAMRQEAQDILDQWKAGDATEDSFAALANEKSADPGSNTNGGLYEDVVPGQMVAAFNDWCFDESRQPGDTGLVETSYGVHVMYFVGNSQQNYRDYQAEQAIVAEKYETWYTALVEAMTAKDGVGRGLALKVVEDKKVPTKNSGY